MSPCSYGTAAAAEGNGQKAQQLLAKKQRDSGRVHVALALVTQAPSARNKLLSVLSDGVCFGQAVNVLREFIHRRQVSQRYCHFWDFQKYCAHIDGTLRA